MKTLILVCHFLLIVAVTINAQQNDFPKLTGPYLGQTPPGTTPEIFAKGIVSTDEHEFSCCFSPDGNECYFTRMQSEQRQNFIMLSTLIDSVWTEPSIAPFAGTFTFEPFITPDNKRVYFQTGEGC